MTFLGESGRTPETGPPSLAPFEGMVYSVHMATRDDLLEAARTLYLKEGLQGVSMRSVADRAGVSAPAIYRHFENKEDLVFELCRAGHRIFGTYLGRGLEGRTARERLVATGIGYLEFALDHPAYYAIMFITPPSELGFDKLGSRNLEEGGRTFQMLVDRVRECVDERVLARRDPLEVSFEIWAHVHGIASLHLRACEAGEPVPPIHEPAMIRAFFAASLERLLRGLAPS